MSVNVSARPFLIPDLLKTITILTALSRLILPFENKSYIPARPTRLIRPNALCQLRMATQTRKSRLHSGSWGSFPIFPSGPRVGRIGGLCPGIHLWPSPGCSQKLPGVRPGGVGSRDGEDCPFAFGPALPALLSLL